jgi:plastocyanin domain-containing protein
MKPVYYIILTALIVAIAAFFIFGNIKAVGKTIGDSSSVGEKDSGNIQKIVLSMKNYNYYPNTITVKSGQPVRIYLDSSVGGCYRSFTIRDFKITKYLKTPDDYIEFTPNKKGSFRFACAMGMGTGTLIVE